MDSVHIFVQKKITADPSYRSDACQITNVPVTQSITIYSAVMNYPLLTQKPVRFHLSSICLEHVKENLENIQAKSRVLLQLNSQFYSIL